MMVGREVSFKVLKGGLPGEVVLIGGEPFRCSVPEARA